MDDKFELTPEQEKKLLDTWNERPNNPPSFAELSLAIFNEEHDGRDQYGLAIKRCLAKHNLKAKTKANQELKTSKIDLNEDKRTYILNNASTMTPIDMARILFNNPTLGALSAETRVIAEFVKTIDTKVLFNGNEAADNIPTKNYEPPKTVERALRRVNQYVNYILDKDKITNKQKKDLEQLINYLHTYRFIKQINNYDREDDRKSFEDAFIRYTYDKPDLSQEEVDQYIVLAHEVVISFKIQRRVEKLQVMMEEISDTNPDNARISMSLVEAINTAQTEYNQCVTRQQKLLDDLKEKRSSRVSKQIKDNASILNLLHVWKEEETRKDMLKLAEKEQKQIEQEVDRLSSMEELKARILGLTKNEILYE